MKVILHTGAHCTDEDRLLKTLLRNADRVRDAGVVIPGPGRYRQLLTDMLNSVTDADLAPDARDVLLEDAMDLDTENANRLILSHENLFTVPKLLFKGGLLYRHAEFRLAHMRALFAEDDLHLYMALRDPASFLPAVFAATPHEDFSEFMAGCDPLSLRWSDLIRRIRMDVPTLNITLWCNEDTPLIWGVLLRDMLGLHEGTRINGGFDVLSNIMTTEGMTRFRAFLAEHPTISEPQKQRVMAAFLDKYAVEDEIEEELDLPGWDADYVAQLTAIYDADVQTLMQMEGVRVITPAALSA